MMRLITSCWLLLNLLMFSAGVRADISWSFQLINDSVLVSGNDVVSVYGSLVNSSLSDEALIISEPCDTCSYNVTSAALTTDPNLFNYYSFDEGPLGAQDLSSLLTGISIQPGSSLSFLFYSLVPTASPVPTGIYHVDYNALGLQAGGLFLFNDGGVFSITVVPEPDSWAMLLAGLSLVGWSVRRRKT